MGMGVNDSRIKLFWGRGVDGAMSLGVWDCSAFWISCRDFRSEPTSPLHVHGIAALGKVEAA